MPGILYTKDYTRRLTHDHTTHVAMLVVPDHCIYVAHVHYSQSSACPADNEVVIVHITLRIARFYFQFVVEETHSG